MECGIGPVGRGEPSIRQTYEAIILVARKIGPDWTTLYMKLPFTPERNAQQRKKDIQMIMQSSTADTLPALNDRSLRREVTWAGPSSKSAEKSGEKSSSGEVSGEKSAEKSGEKEDQGEEPADPEEKSSKESTPNESTPRREKSSKKSTPRREHSESAQAAKAEWPTDLSVRRRQQAFALQALKFWLQWNSRPSDSQLLDSLIQIGRRDLIQHVGRFLDQKLHRYEATF